jgi:hypothetical protein
LDLHYPTSSDPPGYLFRWEVVKAPLTVSNSSEPFPGTGGMGVSVAVGDLDNDGLAEVLTGRYERFSPDEFAPGRAHLFWGSYLTAHAPPSSGGHTVVVPPEAETATSTVTLEGSQPAYQTLYDPAGHHLDWFGWIVYMFDYDLGGPGYGTSSWERDIAVHGENDYGWQDNDYVIGQGCLSVYFGNSNELEDSLVDGYAVRLQVPANSGEPQQADRFGRMAVDMPWRDTNGSPITTLWVDAPNHTFSESRSQGGAVFCFKAPLDTEGGMDNAWGTFVLKEVADSVAEKARSTPGELIDDESDMDPQGSSNFGAMMIRLRYSDGFVGDQIAISARGRLLDHVAGVGQVYTFYLDDN